MGIYKLVSAFVPNGGMTAVSSQASGAQRRLRVGKIMDSKII